MRDEIEELRAAVAGLPEGNGKRFPATVRREITRLGERMRREGMTWPAISAALGVHMASVRRLCRQKASPFTRVEVSDAEPRPVLVSAGGHRVEGLSIAQLAELLGRLR